MGGHFSEFINKKDFCLKDRWKRHGEHTKRDCRLTSKRNPDNLAGRNGKSAGLSELNRTQSGRVRTEKGFVKKKRDRGRQRERKTYGQESGEGRHQKTGVLWEDLKIK